VCNVAFINVISIGTISKDVIINVIISIVMVSDKANARTHLYRCPDTQHNDTQHNDIQHNDIQHIINKSRNSA
jgi:hypothetical protein